MSYLLSASHIKLPYQLSQEKIMEFSREIFGASFKNIERLLQAFKNGQVENRYFSNDLDWFREDHTFQEKNEVYVKQAVEFGKEAVEKCLVNTDFLKNGIHPNEIDAFFYISSTGIATPTIDARIMNELPFNSHMKRIPIWGLGCAGGASGLSRAFEYCKAFPKAKVIVLCVELCSLTFQKNDISKSNLIGTSLFSDGISCVLICGDDAKVEGKSNKDHHLHFLNSQSTLMPNSLDVMGWDLKDQGLHVIFSKDIPTIIKEWLKPNVEDFLKEEGLRLGDIKDFIAHPGGKKVIDAYHESLGFNEGMTAESMAVLREFGNMSSATILYVLERFMKRSGQTGQYGLAAALGPGFSSELVLMRWN
ncbi:type III polyketide synthase [Peribacillus sp. NPDC097224]|uniref:type III polyketide synthase n=1 Tax=Peribacillus sp. NPDC097224 TaxID=3364399 RepID=UPI00380CC763